jgi:DNA-binding NtrC family response regulator
MMDGSRRLLTMGCDVVGNQIAASLKQYHWETMHVRSVHEARHIIERGEHLTAILILIDADLQQIEDFQKLVIQHPPILWIATVDPRALKLERIRHLIQHHFYAFLLLPLDSIKARHILESAREMASLIAEESPALTLPLPQMGELGMIGSSPSVQNLYRCIHRMAPVEAPILITGESGTGKELVARAIHDRSSRRSGPFCAVNCGALSPGLIQSELFGHDKGAFTGANQRKIGFIESADSGTLFLDEIGDLPLDMQVNLLRFLESHRITRLGDPQEISVDVRVLAATHVNLEDAIRQGKFRPDLYHRLSVLQLSTPPLRERSEDIEALATFFFHKFRSEKTMKVRGFSRDSFLLMRQYSWPGNIRELINRVRQALVMCDQHLISPEDLGLERRQGFSRSQLTLEQAREKAEQCAIRASLARNKNQIQHAARELEVSRATLYRLIEKHGIDRPSERHA